MPHSKLHSMYTLSIWVRHTGRQFYACCRSVSFSPLSEGKQRSYHLFWWPLADKNRVAAAILLLVQQQQQLSEQLLGFHHPAFILSSSSKKCDGSVMACHRFWLKRKRINAQIGRWEHIRQISCDDANSCDMCCWRWRHIALAQLHLWVTINMTSAGWTDRAIQPALHVLDLQSFKLPGRLLVLFLVCDFFYFYILLQLYYGRYLHRHPPTKLAFICSHHLM